MTQKCHACGKGDYLHEAWCINALRAQTGYWCPNCPHCNPAPTSKDEGLEGLARRESQ